MCIKTVQSGRVQWCCILRKLHLAEDRCITLLPCSGAKSLSVMRLHIIQHTACRTSASASGSCCACAGYQVSGCVQLNQGLRVAMAVEQVQQWYMTQWLGSVTHVGCCVICNLTNIGTFGISRLKRTWLDIMMEGNLSDLGLEAGTMKSMCHMVQKTAVDAVQLMHYGCAFTSCRCV